MSTHDDDDRDYEVGYCRPPKSTRFKKGKSGNSNGRPKSSKPVGAILEEVFNRKIPTTENGKQRKISLLEAILRQLANGAAKGELRHIDRVLKLLPMIQEARAAATSDDMVGQAGDGSSDLAVLEALSEMFGGDPDQLFATIQAEVRDEQKDDP
jgi:hypothetical protein